MIEEEVKQFNPQFPAQTLDERVDRLAPQINQDKFNQSDIFDFAYQKIVTPDQTIQQELEVQMQETFKRVSLNELSEVCVAFLLPNAKCHLKKGTNCGQRHIYLDSEFDYNLNTSLGVTNM